MLREAYCTPMMVMKHFLNSGLFDLAQVKLSGLKLSKPHHTVFWMYPGLTGYIQAD